LVVAVHFEPVVEPAAFEEAQASVEALLSEHSTLCLLEVAGEVPSSK